ncbi:MAG: hypothetical protein FJ206_07025 [Gemmatimonadetes bacterium]|nr:hypothetical protein [Gemmatimonadota bacterium]
MTTKATNDRFETYEVFDERGRSVGRVILPRSRRMFGAEKGTVLLTRQPPKTSPVPVKPRAA